MCSHVRPPDSNENGDCLFWIVYAASRQPYRPANLDCKSVEGYSWFISAERLQKQSSMDVVFLGGPFHCLSLTSPVIWSLAFSLKIVRGLTTNNPQRAFAEHQLDVDPSHGPTQVPEAQNKSQKQQQNNLFGIGREDLAIFLIKCNLHTCSAAHPTNACSLQIWNCFKGN